MRYVRLDTLDTHALHSILSECDVARDRRGEDSECENETRNLESQLDLARVQ